MQIKKVFRQERKFLISGEQYYRFSRQFAELFKEDSHNGKDGYMVRSLYFDTLGNKDFEEKLAGVECRRKMRLRIYSPQSRTALLVILSQRNVMVFLRRIVIYRKSLLNIREWRLFSKKMTQGLPLTAIYQRQN